MHAYRAFMRMTQKAHIHTFAEFGSFRMCASAMSMLSVGPSGEWRERARRCAHAKASKLRECVNMSLLEPKHNLTVK